MKAIHLVLLILVGLLTITPAASAATGTGTLYVTNASDVEKGSTATVSIYLKNDFDLKIGAYHVRMYFNKTIVNPTDIQALNASNSNKGDDYVLLSGYNTDGYNHGDLLLGRVTLEALADDGSVSELRVWMMPDSFADTNNDDLPMPAIQNGIFTTKDEVDPEIKLTLATGDSVPSTFIIAGTIYDVGGVKTAKATLKNATSTKEYSLDLTQNGATYTFNRQVTWPVEDGVTLTVTAIDAARRTGKKTATINVIAAGFSDPIPAPESYINEIPESASVLITEMLGPVTMCLGNATYEKDLDATIEGNCAKGTLPRDLADGEYWVNVSGTDNYGNLQSRNWTFTLDTKAPKIDTFTITDSDGDGYIEAGEDLTLNWKVTDPNFEHVALVDKKDTDKELWRCGSSEGIEKVVIDVGNRDLEFRAYDTVDNYAKREFHIYNNYMIWVNSTKVDKVLGIDTTYTAAKDLSRIGVSSITLHNGREVPLPTLDSLERTVTRLGQVTPDTHVTVDNTANRKLEGTETYQKAWVYEPDTVLDFTVKVPNTQKAVLVLAEANESYIAGLIEGGKSSMSSVDYMELVKKTAYIFIDGGWTNVTIDDEGKVKPDYSSGKNITINASDPSATGVLRHHKNQVDLSGSGYRLGDQNLQQINLPPGDYALAAITIDGDRLGLLAAMPVVVMKSDEQASISSLEVEEGDDITVSFNSSCKRLDVVLLRNVTYSGTALIDAATLGKDTLHLNLTYDGILATQNLIGNIYVSPRSGNRVVGNVSCATISTTGLDPDTYYLYALGTKDQKVVAVDQKSIKIDVKPQTGEAKLPTDDSGNTTKPIAIQAADGNVSLSIPKGIRALNATGNPLNENVTINRSTEVPEVPAGATFKLVENCTYTLGPDGAKFNPPITLTFEIPEDVWKTLDPENNDFTVKWYNKETGQWEDIPTEVIPGTKCVMAKIEHFSTFALFTEPKPPEPEPAPYTPGRSGGGGGGSSYTSYTATGTLKVGNTGTVLRSIKVNAEDKFGSLFVPIGTKALDKDGNPLTGITLTAVSSDTMPAVPSGAAFMFAGYVYEASPSGATFDPAITITFEIPEDAWKALDPENNDFTVKWYNKETGQWEDVPTTVYKSTRSVDAEITHFSTFALFTEPVTTTTTPTETDTPVTPTKPTPPAEEPPAEEFPMMMILAIFAVLVIVIAAGYFFMVRK